MGTLLAVGALAFVLFPLFVGAGVLPARIATTAKQTAGAAEQDAVVALREIEFDRATGKLSDSDYDELRARYTQHALDAMRSGAPAGVAADPAEAAVLAYRARLKDCMSCGPRPEPDATYCSNCGRYLPGSCGACGASVAESGAMYCNGCGRALTA
ncbi:MAG: hypothetical protein JWM95_2945 [Gemmatimonadetes bacterium]|nr:hypothetical protein [Gemmatimonadota bacterium]